MRVFKTKWFARYARSEGIEDVSLREAVDRAERGSVDAELGSGLFKQRVARKGQGRSSGYRVLIAFRHQSRAVFLYGFAKSARDNIDPDELATAREIAAAWLRADELHLARAVDDGELQEIEHGEKIE